VSGDHLFELRPKEIVKLLHRLRNKLEVLKNACKYTNNRYSSGMIRELMQPGFNRIPPVYFALLYLIITKLL